MTRQKKLTLFILIMIGCALLMYIMQACVIRVKDIDVRTKQETDKDNSFQERK